MSKNLQPPESSIHLQPQTPTFFVEAEVETNLPTCHAREFAESQYLWGHRDQPALLAALCPDHTRVVIENICVYIHDIRMITCYIIYNVQYAIYNIKYLFVE